VVTHSTMLQNVEKLRTDFSQNLETREHNLNPPLVARQTNPLLGVNPKSPFLRADALFLLCHITVSAGRCRTCLCRIFPSGVTTYACQYRPSAYPGCTHNSRIRCHTTRKSSHGSPAFSCHRPPSPRTGSTSLMEY